MKIDTMWPKSEIPLSLLIERLSRLMRAAEHEQGLNPAQWQALRYLDRANRFSNSPGALAKYLGATKGTVSQTVIALERKGFLRRHVRQGERRSVALALTAKGRAQLQQDPWQSLASDIAALDARSARNLARGLKDLLHSAMRRGTHPTFGQCRTCRYFGRNRASGQPGGPHRCLLLDLALMDSDSLKICVEHEPRIRQPEDWAPPPSLPHRRGSRTARNS